MKTRKSKLIRNIGIGVVIIILFSAIIFIIWLSRPYLASERALSFLSSDEYYTFSSDEFLSFIPKNKSDSGVIFYPGGLVEAESYTPTCAQIASMGVNCIITKMPLNLAILSIDKANNVIERYPEIENWVIGGHSLGGAAAARFIQNNSVKISGLFLLGSYSDIDISNLGIKVVALYGTNDMIFDSETLLNYKKNLPMNTRYIEIKGGNHSQFGEYGLQSGDGIAEISRAEQEQIVVDNIIKLFE